ncbi:MAG: 50S ribosomal protein L18 [Nevskiales bacterium]
MDKKTSRLRRARRARAKILELGAHRLTVHRTPQHIYAQVIAPARNQTLAAASTVEKAVRSKLKGTGNKDAAAVVGKLIAERALKAGVEKVAFDRAGFKFHGRIQALAQAARDAGLKF